FELRYALDRFPPRPGTLRPWMALAGGGVAVLSLLHVLDASALTPPRSAEFLAALLMVPWFVLLALGRRPALDETALGAVVLLGATATYALFDARRLFIVALTALHPVIALGVLEREVTRRDARTGARLRRVLVFALLLAAPVMFVGWSGHM